MVKVGSNPAVRLKEKAQGFTILFQRAWILHIGKSGGLLPPKHRNSTQSVISPNVQSYAAQNKLQTDGFI